MRYSIRTNLVLTYLAIAILTASLIYLLIRLTSDQRLKTLLLEQQISEIVDEVATWYEAEGGWDHFGEYFKALHPLTPESRPNPLGQPVQKPLTPRRGRHGVIDDQKRVLIRFLDFSDREIVPDAYLVNAVAVVVDGVTVAWVVPDDESGISLQSEELIYLRRTDQVLLIATTIAVCGALLIGYGFASLLLRPIHNLIKASEAMARGDLKQEIGIHLNDELGQLTASFNMMSHEVTKANQRRRQMVADITHDLSTPLQIIAGYIEVIQDETLEATPERIAIIATEIEHLRRLVNDLDLLVQTDSKTLSLTLEPIDFAEYLPKVVKKYAPLARAKSIELTLEPLSALPSVQGDRERLTQVIGNLITNALRHTPESGLIQVIAQYDQNRVHLHVRDTGSGIAPNDLPFIFDRFYQADPSRNTSGKMGLGLAISKALVEAMNGHISVESGYIGQGAMFTVSLPLYIG